MSKLLPRRVAAVVAYVLPAVDVSAPTAAVTPAVLETAAGLVESVEARKWSGNGISQEIYH